MESTLTKPRGNMAKTTLFKRLQELVQISQQNSISELAHDPSSSFPRRDFLKASSLISLSLLGATTPSLFLNGCKHKNQSPEDLKAKIMSSHSGPKITIIGGGISGLTTAYYLSKQGVPCQIFEASPRLGGRMFTSKDFNAEHMNCELGGEFIDTNHLDIIELCKELNIPIEAYDSENKFLKYNLQPEFFYFKGQYYSEADALNAMKPFTKKLFEDLNQAEQELDKISVEDYFKTLKDADPWIIDLFRVAFKGEFGLECDEVSAVLLKWSLTPQMFKKFSLFGDSDQAYKIQNGTIQLITALEKQLHQNGVEIFTERPLIAIKEKGSQLELTFQKDPSTETILSDLTVCTIPFSVLRHIQGINELALSPLKKRSIQEMAYGSNAKIIIGYKERFWRSPDPKHPHVPVSTGMIFTDLLSQNIWDMSRLQKGKSGILTSFLGGKEGVNVSAIPTSKIVKTINQIFPHSAAKFDGNSANFDWIHYPLNYGSYSTIKPKQYTLFTSSTSKNSELSGRLYFAGEHATDNSTGFMNGACHSGKKAAQDILATHFQEKTIKKNKV